MPQYILRPNGDIKADWTEDPVGTANAVLDDNVTQPTAPTTGSDRITSATNGQINSNDFGTITLAGGETPTSATLWVYCITPATRDLSISLVKSDGGTSSIASATITAGTTGWGSCTFTGSMTQARIDGLQASLTNGNGSGTTEVDAMYIELNTQTGSGGLLLRGLG